MLKKETRIDIILSEDNKKDIKANNLKKVIDDIISRKDDIDEIGYNQTLTYLYDLDNDFINREIFLNKFQDSIKNSDYINMGFYSFLAEQLTKSGRYLETIEMLKDKEGCEHKYYFQKTLFLYKGISLINLNDNDNIFSLSQDLYNDSNIKFATPNIIKNIEYR